MKDQRTLCGRCAKEYRQAGYYVDRDYTVEDKQPCDKCGRLGWCYWVEEIWQRNTVANSIIQEHGESAANKC